MSNDAPESFSLKRWSQRKRAAALAEASPVKDPAVTPAVSDSAAPAPGDALVPVSSATAETTSATTPLPAIDTLTFESDFSVFMRPGVGEDLKTAALNKLFSDPRFNVMDGLDTYIGDYSIPDPMPPGMLDKLAAVYEEVVDAVDPVAADEGAAKANPQLALALEQPATRTGEDEFSQCAAASDASAALPLPEISEHGAGEVPVNSLATTTERQRDPS